MRLLFVAFAISFCALVWVAFSVARHIQRHNSVAQEPDGLVRKGEISDARDRF
jgi:hypothetical protein